jgi:putative membrane protein insertion efficiency factor
VSAPAAEPRPSAPARAAIGLLAFYKAAISPWLPKACRYEPTCSVYAREAIEKHGLGRGSALALHRLLRCHPFRRGGFDPVP